MVKILGFNFFQSKSVEELQAELQLNVAELHKALNTLSEDLKSGPPIPDKGDLMTANMKAREIKKEITVLDKIIKTRYMSER